MRRSVEGNVDVIRRGYDAINREGPDGARAFMDPDIVLACQRDSSTPAHTTDATR